jgi:glycosyltransferase involved in cell wall biosynthesis
VRLAMNEGLRSELGQGGQKRVRDLYSWQAKGEELAGLYQGLVEAPALAGRGGVYVGE